MIRILGTFLGRFGLGFCFAKISYSKTLRNYLKKQKNMWSYFFLSTFFVFYAFISYKWGAFLISDFLVGFILLLFLTYFYYKFIDRGLIIIFMVNLFFYVLLFFSSVFIYFDKENEKRIYYIFPLLTAFLLMIIEKQIINYDDAFFCMYIPIAGAFFPLYILKYYTKYIK